MTPIWHLSMIGWANNTLDFFQISLQCCAGSICVRCRPESNTKVNCCFYSSTQHQKLVGNVRHAIHTHIEECECFSSFDRSFFNNDGISYHYIHLHPFHSFRSRFHSIFAQVICISMHPSSAQLWNVAYSTAHTNTLLHWDDDSADKMRFTKLQCA